MNDFGLILNAEPDAKGLIECVIIPLQDIIVYPKVICPIIIDDGRALAAAHVAYSTKKTAVGLAIKNAPIENYTVNDFYEVGTEMALGRMINLPENQHSLLVEGRRRVEIVEFTQLEPFIVAKARVTQDVAQNPSDVTVFLETLMGIFEQMVDLNDNLPEEIFQYALSSDDPGWLADFVASTLTINLSEQQQVLEHIELSERLRFVSTLVGHELNRIEIQEEIDDQVEIEIERSQREMYLREQMRIIQSELGEEDVFQQEMFELRHSINTVGLTAEAHEKAMRELRRLQLMPPLTPETGMIRTYLDWLIAIPWIQQSEDNLDVRAAQKILDAEHYGLDKVKDRILEHIAVRKLAAEKMKSPILCFVGPPGVGKTSLGESIARALGREFLRVSLGGVRDEAEIRGHRRTYVGALPGRIIQTLRKARTINPVFMLDEIDKLGVDFRGDPASALLEILDPEQNDEYIDHYLDVSYDLSKVLFITTANDLYPLPAALVDRLELIEFPGYTEEDKLKIAREFLIPKQLMSHGIANITITDSALQTIIREYTYEAGVRNLNREIGTVCRKIARLVAEERRYPRRITPRYVNDYLGPPQFLELRANDVDSVGIVTGLAWTSNGGDILTIEVSVLVGKGTLMLTGQLGDVMQESAQAAMSYARSRAKDFDIPNDDFDNYDVHVHLPEGAVPKDGPSAGITLAMAIISAFTERKIRSDFAMTGEITLRGKVLPVGGIKEKIMAARRAHIKNVILPAQNRKDLVDIPPRTLNKLNIICVDDMQQVIDAALLEPPPDGRERDRDRQEEEAAADNDERTDD